MTSHKTIYSHKTLNLVSDDVQVNGVSITPANGLVEQIAAPLSGAWSAPNFLVEAHLIGPTVCFGFQGQSFATTSATTASLPAGSIPLAYRPLNSSSGLSSGVHNGVAAVIQTFVGSDGSVQFGLQNASGTGVPLPFTINAGANGWSRFSIGYNKNITVYVP
jgi:hypothetical protein